MKHLGPIKRAEDLLPAPLDEGCGDCRHRRGWSYCVSWGQETHYVRFDLRGRACPFWAAKLDDKRAGLLRRLCKLFRRVRQ